MELTAFEWVLIGGGAALAIGVIGFFLVRTIRRVDKHDEDINGIHREYARCEIVAAQNKDINDIKLTYVTKNDLRQMESEFKASIEKLTDGIGEIKENFLPKEDYYRTSVETARKLDQIQNLIIEKLGGRNSDKP